MRTPFTRFDRRILIGATLVLLALALVAAAVLLARSSSSASPTTSNPGAPDAASRRSTASLNAYEGLGSWVDLYDTPAWRDPKAAVKDMAKHGVKTIYVQTANDGSSSGIVHPKALRTFITQAHARHMYVVAWYLPSLGAGSTDYDRVMEAIRFTTQDGQTFDSFALDIESTDVKSERVRNARLAALSAKIRDCVGSDYALGAIIPSPVALDKRLGYWDDFPYSDVARLYDVILPMGYYTFHVHGGAATYAETVSNVQILRTKPGCSSIPVHLIGGLAEKSSTSEVKQFVRRVAETGCIGGSLYGWPGTSGAAWRELAAIKGGGGR